MSKFPESNDCSLEVGHIFQEPNDTDLTRVDMDWFEEQVWEWKGSYL